MKDHEYAQLAEMYRNGHREAAAKYNGMVAANSEKTTVVYFVNGRSVVPYQLHLNDSYRKQIADAWEWAERNLKNWGDYSLVSQL